MPSYPYALTLVNPGAETGDMTGWTAQVAGFRAVTARVHTGTYSFEGGVNSANPISYQDVALPSEVLTDVDADLLRVEAGAWQNDWSGDGDYCWFEVECRDGSGTVLATEASSPVGNANETYVHRTLNLRVPAGTRTVRYYIKGHRISGSGLSAHLDDLTLELQEENPTLSSPTGTATGQTTADGSVSTNIGTGTLYAIVQESSVGTPSVAQIQAGLDGDGSAAPYDTSQAVSGTGAQAVAATGLTADTEYVWCYQQDDGTTDSAVVTSAAFSTDPIPGLRSTLAGVYVASSHIPQLRSTLAGVYVASTTLHYQLRTTLAGVYVVESLPLPPAYLTVVASDYDEATLAWTDRTDAEEGFRVYRSTTTSFTADGSTLIHTTAADVEEYVDGTGLLPGYRYYWRVAAFSAAGQQLSSEVTTVMPSRLGVPWVNATDAGLVFGLTDGSTEVQYQTTLASDTGWTAVVDDATEIGDGLRFHTATGLTDETDYMARARERLAAGTWGAWHYASFTTAEAPALMEIGEFTSPRDYAVVSGSITLRWDLDWDGRLSGWRPTALLLSDDGADFVILAPGTALGAGAQGSFVVDTTAYEDGFLTFMLEAENADASKVGVIYLTVFVDNAAAYTDMGGITCDEYEASNITGTKHVHSNYFVQKYGEEMFGGDCDDGRIVTWGEEIAVQTPDMILEDGVVGFGALVRGQAICNNRVGYFWWFNLEIEGSFVAIDALDQFGNVLATAETSIFNPWPILPCDNRSNLVANSSSSLKTAGGRRRDGTGNTRYTLHQMHHRARGGWPGECQVYPGTMMVHLSMVKVDTNQYRVSYIGDGGWRTPDNPGPRWRRGLYEEVRTYEQTPEGDDVCLAGYRLRIGRGPGAHLGGFVRGGGGGQKFYGPDACAGIQIPDEEPEEPPEIEEPCPPPPPEAPLPPEPSQRCAAHLTVYDDDRLTPLWTASTDPDDATADKILVEPDSYAEQEVDFAEGTASITAATVEVIDPPRTPGDQDTGLTTYRLVRDGITAMAGLRHRLLRWISESVGWVTIADGPGGFPRLGDTYSSYTTEIRDVRESERKLEAFTDSPDVVDECLGIVPRYVTIFPHGVTAPWGDIHGDGSEYLLDAAEPITGIHSVVDFYGLSGTQFGITTHETYASFQLWPDYLVLTDALREMGEARVVEATGQTNGTQPLYRMEWPHLQIWWRYPGEEDWHVSRLGTETATADAPTNLFSGHTTTGVVVVGYDESDAPIFEQRTVVESLPTFNSWFIADPDQYIPLGQELEFMLVYVGEASESAPILIETTAGALLRQLYEGYWSPRDEDGAVVDPGIRYDATALDAMTQPVRLIMRETADDVRRWAEEHLYKPRGFAPSLDQFGRIAPTSQRIDVDPATLITVGDAGIEPGPDWCAGDRVVNSIEFRYPRTWVVDGPDPDMEQSDFAGLVREPREVRVQERSDLSIARFGEQRWETDGIACVALGNSDGAPLGLLADEWGWQLAAERRVHVFGRWRFGTPYADLTCLRSLTATLRVGDWLTVEPSWMPSYATGERGITDGYAQIIAIADLDCAWRRLTVELVPAGIALWGVSYETTAAFGAGAGLGAVALSSQSESTMAVFGAGAGMRTSTRAGSTATQSETTSGTFGAGAGSADT